MARPKTSPTKQRFAVGAKVVIKMPGVPGVVTQLDDEPTVLWEYWHTVLTEHGERREPGSNLELVPTPKTNSSEEINEGNDRKFARLAIEEARKSVSEPDGRPHPKVGAVVVKNGNELSRAHRGERPENHAEYIALEKKLADEAVAGATVYTTLEPCTTRNHPKIPCADRLVERKVTRVVIGMLDPDDRISGKGQRKLRRAGIVTDLFPHDLAMEVEELNREFTRYCEQHSHTEPQPADKLTPDESTPALAAQRPIIREKSAGEILGNLKGISPSYRFHETVEQLYVGRWTPETGWQATVHTLPSKLSAGGSWYCSFREVESGILVIVVTARDLSMLRRGDLVTIRGRIKDVSRLDDVSLEDATVEHSEP